jgi:TP901 family phage tail tape measure protein
MASRPIVIQITGSDSGLQKALTSASKGVTGFAAKIGKLGAKAGLAFAGLAGAVAVTSVKAVTAFQDSMNEVFTLLPGEGKAAFDKLEAQTLQFAKTFGVLPDKVVPALYSALSAGVPKDNVFKFLEVAQKAAKGGVTDLETAVDGISSVVNTYGSEVISASEASDLLFTAVKLGKTTFGEMSSTISAVAPIAASLGVEFKDVTTSIANLTALGVPTATAMTQMKGALAELGKQGTKADTAFRELNGMGITQFLASEGDFATAMQSMKDGADAAGISVLDMFGSVEAGQAILALTSDGGDKYMETLKAMSDSAGATDTAFSQMNQGLKANMEKISARLEVLKIEIGSKLAPFVVKALDFILESLDKLRDSVPKIKKKFLEFTNYVKNTAIKVFEKIRDVFGQVSDRALDIYKTIKDFLAPVLDTLKDKALEIYNTIRDYLAPGLDTFSDSLVRIKDRAVELLRDGFNKISDWVTNIHIDFEALGTAIGSAFETARSKVMEFVRAIPDGFRTFKAEVTSAVDTVIGKISSFIDWIKRNNKVLSLFAGAIGGLVIAFGLYKLALIISTGVTAVWSAVTTAATAVGLGFLAVTAALSSPILIAVAAFAALTGALVVAYFRFEEVRDIVDTVGRWLKDHLWPIVRTVAENIVDAFTAVASYLKNDFINDVTNAFDKVIEVARKVWTYIDRVFGPAISVAIDIVVDTFTYLVEQWKLAFQLVKALIDGDWSKAFETFKTMVGNAIKFVVEFFIKLPGRLFKALPPIILALLDIAKAFTIYLLEKVGRAITKIVDFFLGLPKQLFDAGVDILKAVIAMGFDIGKGVITGIIDALKALGGQIASTIAGLIPSPGDIASGFLGGLKGAVGGALNSAKGFFGGSSPAPTPSAPTLSLIGDTASPTVSLSRAATSGAAIVNNNIQVNTGVGDPVAIGDEIVEVLNAWQIMNGSIPLDMSAA